MSNIDKQALRIIATAAKSAPSWYAVGEFGDVVDPAKPEWKPVHEFCKTFTAARVLALLDELEVKDKRLNEILTPNMLLPVIDDMDADNLRHVIKTCSENYSLLHAKLEAAERRIAELSASHGKLREAMAGIHNTITGGGAHTPLAAILNASKRAYEESAAAAGKGETS